MMARRFSRDLSFTADVEIPVWEALEQIEDEDLLEEVAKRSLEKKKVEVVVERDHLVEKALECLRARDADEAELLLERFLFPKFPSLESCEKKLKESLGVKP